ncbi:MAG: hypothetical protein ACLFVH_13190 [Phycisphaerae bacterium]
MKTTMAQLASADWEKLERDVVARIRVLAETARAMSRPAIKREAADRIANDLILPNLQLLGAFCEAVEMDPANENSAPDSHSEREAATKEGGARC